MHRDRAALRFRLCWHSRRLRVETLYRLGRGVSYHEFDLAIGLSEFEAIQDGYSNLLKHRGINDFFEGALIYLFERYAPHVPPAFSKQFLEGVAE